MTRGLPVAADRYYLVAAFYIIPLVIGLWQVYGRVAHAVSGAPGTADDTLAALARPWAVPLTVAFVVPDLVVLIGWGHAALAPAMIYYAPVAVLSVVVWSVIALRARQVGTGRAVAAVLAAAIVHGIPASVFLR